MKQLPLDINSFSSMREQGYLYVDKTEHIYTLIESGRLYFLSRPRRFGKSLLISTFEELFSGNKELFKGLWISQSDYQWGKHPVITIDFSGIAADTQELLKTGLLEELDFIAKTYGIPSIETQSVETMLKHLIRTLHAAHGSVVILIDEYDQPLISNLDNIDVAIQNRKLMSSFYKAIKSVDKYLRFVFITGISKFSKASVFSGMTNLNDISLKPVAATLLGYTKTEIEDNLMPYVEAFSHAKQRSIEDIMHEMKQWYDGYSFSEDLLEVYNPFSVHYYLQDQKCDNYWFSTATPSFLISLIEQRKQDCAQRAEDGKPDEPQSYELEKIEQATLSSKDTQAFDIRSLPLHAVLYQTGYLTIDSYDQGSRQYKLKFPNLEVKDSFLVHLANHMTQIQ